MMGTFGEYSKYYNLLYKDKSYENEAKYVHDLIQKHKPHAEKLLELGCGTGRHALELAKYNYKIKGIDLSAEMLLEADKLLENSDINGSIRFEKGDVRSFRCEEKYDACISLFHVMSYQITNEDILNSFITAAHHLEKDGIFVFDCWYGPAVLTDRPALRVKRLEDSEVQVLRIAEPALYPNDNIVDVNYEIIVRDKCSGKSNSFGECHRMRYLFLPEIKQYMALAGLELVDTAEFLSNREIGFQSWYACFVGKKK